MPISRSDRREKSSPTTSSGRAMRTLVRGLALLGGLPAAAAAQTEAHGTDSFASATSGIPTPVGVPARPRAKLSPPVLPCAPHRADLLREPVLRFGAEFEVMHLGPQELERLVAGEVGAVKSTPMTWRMWLGLDAVPNKGRDEGWKIAPELAFPHNTYEVITPALNAGGIDDIRRVGRVLHEAGAKADSDAAFHVHLEHRTLRTGHINTLVQLWHVHGEMLFRLSNTNIRQRNLYARDIEPALAQALSDQPPRTRQALRKLAGRTRTADRYFSMADHAMRFYAINLANILRAPTLEMRPYQFADTPHPDQAVAFVELSLALALFVRDGGDARCLLATRLNPDNPADVDAFLDIIGLTQAAFPTTRAELKKHTQRDHGFLWQDGERRGVATDAAIGLGAAAFQYSLRTGASGAAALRATAHGVALAAGLRCAAVTLEALGVSDYRNTYAARDMTYTSVVQARLVAGAVFYLLNRLRAR